jgi:septal ring factor EnvC (AmiA/AmiB activator)
MLLYLGEFVNLSKSILEMEEIKSIIAALDVEITSLKAELSELKASNSALSSNLSQVTAQLHKREEELKDFQAKIDDLTQQIKITEQNQQAQKQDGVVVSEVEIDALVREIDECINRLKQVG